ncbi:Hypothetical predicted protein [Olea europaea subsp. europaea]|uniref:Uncharacterized protein n=1 Tax=Olea europaea subsp. europaea TaxID=158383 RepID=A0A8S0U1H4_OLEEU|nr:Hypothetical predicted protein [Olea europaea subsp. europaea]
MHMERPLEGNDENALDGTENSSNEDPIFTDSGNELDSREDDNLYERNVTDEIEVGLNVGELNDVNEMMLKLKLMLRLMI